MKLSRLIPFLLSLVLATNALAQRKYYIDGVNGSDAVSAASNSATTPWQTISGGWYAKVFAVSQSMNVGDEVVISGTVREPAGVVLDCVGAGYAVGSRYMKGFRQWNYALDGPVGTVGTQTEQDNSILRARLTSAVVLAGTTSGGGGAVATLSVTNLGSTIAATDTLGYLTYKYYKNIDKYGRHYGHFLQKTGGAVAVIGSQDYNYTTTGASTSTITLDGTNVAASPAITDFEYTRASIGAILLFQNWEGHGSQAEALLEGITLDRAIHRTSGAYLASMENCQNTGFRNCVGYDGGHHGFGITGSGNVGCWLDNCSLYGLYGINSSGGLGGNSMASSGVTVQTNFAWTASTKTMTGTFSSQQCPLPGTIIEVTAGATLGLYTVAEATSSTSFTLTTALSVSDIGSGINFKVRNRCDYNTVSNFNYHIYPPLGLITSSGAATALATKACIGLSQAHPASSSEDAPCTGNSYRRGNVVMYPETLATGGASHCISMGNRCNSYTAEAGLWNPDAYNMLVEDVNFTGMHCISAIECRDIAFRRCNFNFSPSTFTNAGGGFFAIRMYASNAAAATPLCRMLMEGCTVLANMSGTGAAHGALIGSGSTNGNNQTGWNWTASTKTLTGTFTNCPIPPIGAYITITAGTGVTVPQAVKVVSTTSTTIVVDTSIKGSDISDVSVAFDVNQAEFRAANSTFLCTSGDFGKATPVVVSQSVVYDTGGPASLRGGLFHFYGCILGFDRPNQATNQNIFIGDTNQGNGTATGARRISSGCVYVNATSLSGATSFTTNATFLHRSTGIDRTGWADNSNNLMNGCLSGAIFPNSHLALYPPAATAYAPVAGSNRLRYSGAPGAFQFGRPLDDLSLPRGRGR